MSEEIFSPKPYEELSEEEALSRLLKEKGVEDPEVRESLVIWTRKQETKVEESPDPEDEIIYFELRRARLYFNSGHRKEAFQAFKDAHLLADNMRKDALAEEIEKEIRSLGLTEQKE